MSHHDVLLDQVLRMYSKAHDIWLLDNVTTLKFEETAVNSGIFELMDGQDVMTKDDAPMNTNNEPVETPTLQITLPESMTLDNTDRTIDLYTYGTNNIRIDT